MKQWGTVSPEPKRAKGRPSCPPERPCGCGSSARAADEDGTEDRDGPTTGDFDATLTQLRQRARQRAALYAVGGGLVGLVPLPVSDSPLLLTIETKLAGDIARLYDPETSRRQIARMAPVIGSAAMAMRAAAKLVRKCVGRWSPITDGLIALGGVMLVGEAAAWWSERKMRE